MISRGIGLLEICGLSDRFRRADGDGRAPGQRLFQTDKPTGSGLTAPASEFVAILFGRERNPRHEDDCRYRGWRWGRILVQRLRRRCPCVGSRVIAPLDMLKNCADERGLCNRRDDTHWPGASRGDRLSSRSRTRGRCTLHPGHAQAYSTWLYQRRRGRVGRIRRRDGIAAPPF